MKSVGQAFSEERSLPDKEKLKGGQGGGRGFLQEGDSADKKAKRQNNEKGAKYCKPSRWRTVLRNTVNGKLWRNRGGRCAWPQGLFCSTSLTGCRYWRKCLRPGRTESAGHTEKNKSRNWHVLAESVPWSAASCLPLLRWPLALGRLTPQRWRPVRSLGPGKFLQHS